MGTGRSKPLWPSNRLQIKVCLKRLRICPSSLYTFHHSQKEMEYRELLQKAREKLPKSVCGKERFEIPKISGHIQGNRTILSNFLQIADTLRRQPEHLLKYILKELATPGEIKKNGSVIIGTKINALRINEKITQYANEFVLCSECGKPDTKIEKDDGFTFLKCQVCGAKHPIKAKI